MAVLLVLLALLPQERAETLRARLDRAVEKRWPAGARGGILVTDLADGRELWAHEAEASLAPASNAKLFTTAAALARLGADFHFETHAAAVGGALHVWGGGDPNLSGRFVSDGDPTAIFRSWAAKLKEAGVARVADLVLHEPPGDGVDSHPDWAEYAVGPWWTAPVAWYSLNDNCVDVTVAPGARAGEPARVTLSPPTAAVTVTNASTTVASVARNKELTVGARPGGVAVARQIALKAPAATHSIAIADPTRFFGTVLAETLRREGIEVTGNLVRTTEAPPDVGPAATHRSDLARTLQVTNTRSQNFYAELLARRLAVEAGRPATFDEGARAVNAFAAEIGARSTALADGSGLSRRSRTSARDVVTLLSAMARRQDFPLFRDSLAVGGGEEGTLRKRFGGARIKGRVTAKTGTLAGVDALSGYVSTHGGATVAFSILLNGEKSGADARALIDAICEAIVEY